MAEEFFRQVIFDYMSSRGTSLIW